MLQKIVISFTIGIIILFLTALTAYNKGSKTATLICEKEKNELIIQHNTEKDAIIAKIRKKSPVERRKELSRYVIY